MQAASFLGDDHWFTFSECDGVCNITTAAISLNGEKRGKEWSFIMHACVHE